jgi:Ni,Fe-hydrogenase III component G
MRDAFLGNYVFTGEKVVVLQVRINREKPEVPSLAQLIPGAIVYERELKDLFGIIPVGHPDLRRQAVPEDWPEGVYPLRKDVQFNRAGEVMAQEAK